MRTLKYAILGLLSEKDMTGYDIYKSFEGPIGNFWSAKHSQIYPELKKLNQEGLVDYKIGISGQYLEKKIYTLTKKGKADLIEWLNQDEAIDPTYKDKFRLRVFFSSNIDDKRSIELLESQITQHQEKYDRLYNNYMIDYENQEITKENRGDYLVLRGALSREEAYLEWLRDCLEYYK